MVTFSKQVLQFIFLCITVDVIFTSSDGRKRKCKSGDTEACRFNMEGFNEYLVKLKIKQQILKELGLPERPRPRRKERNLDIDRWQNFTVSPTVVKSNTTEFMIMSQSAENFTNKNIIKFQPQFIFDDDWSPEKGKIRVKSANLMIRVKRKRRPKKQCSTTNPLASLQLNTQSPPKSRKRREKAIKLTVSTVNDAGKPDKKVAMVRTRVSRSKWYNITLPSSFVQSMIDQSKTSLLLHVKCKRCRKNAEIILVHGLRRRRRHLKQKTKGKVSKRRRMNEQRPMLQLVTFNEPRAESRYKRSSSISRNRHGSGSCSGNCCMYPYVINFGDIGWGDWMIAPLSFETAMCIGECGSNEDHRGTSCQPAYRQNLAVLHFNNDGQIFYSSIKDLVVKNCTCA